jgi:hypothetical protein
LNRNSIHTLTSQSASLYATANILSITKDI